MICLKFVFLQLTVLLTAKCKAKFEQDIYVYIFKKMGWFFFHKTTDVELSLEALCVIYVTEAGW